MPSCADPPCGVRVLALLGEPGVAFAGLAGEPAGDEAAFRMLVKSSQDTNMKLTDVARWLTSETGKRHARLA